MNALIRSTTRSPLRYIFMSWLFMLFCIELILMGPGNWSIPYGFNFRKLLFAMVALVFTIHYFCTQKISRDDLYLLLGGSTFFVLFGLVVPALYGTNLRYAFADFSPLAGLIFIPFFVQFYLKSNRWKKDRHIIAAALLTLSLLHLLMWVLGTISRDLGEAAIATMQSIYEPGIAVDNSKIAINYTPSGGFRVQWGSSCLLILTLYFGISYWLKHKSLASLLYLSISCAAILTTQSRGIFFAILFGICHFIYFYYFSKLGKLGFAKYLQATFITLIAAMLILPLFSPELLSYIGITRDGSDDERFTQIPVLASNLLSHLFFGSGFGSGVSIIRSEAAPYAFEVSILSLLMKIGLVGLIAGMVLIAFQLSLLSRGPINFRHKKNFVIIFSISFIYVIASNTNPYLSNFFGMFVFYCLALELVTVNQQQR